MKPARLARALALGLAVLACAWYALSVRQSTDAGRAARLVSASRLSPAQAHHATSLIDAAAQLNPDRQVQILRAQLAYDRGRLAAARGILKKVIAAEPENLQAWFLLAKSSSNDPAEFRVTVGAIRKLIRFLPAS